MHRTLLAAAAIIALSAADVFADAFSDAVISDLQLNGYNNIEITTGPTQLKVEASDGVNRIAIIYFPILRVRATGFQPVCFS